MHMVSPASKGEHMRYSDVPSGHLLQCWGGLPKKDADDRHSACFIRVKKEYMHAPYTVSIRHQDTSNHTQGS